MTANNKSSETVLKPQFGSILTRFGWFGPGNSITAAEHYVLSTLISNLPSELRSLVEQQFEAYNLMQREIDARALNFFAVATLFSKAPAFPSLPEGKMQVFPLIAGTFQVDGLEKPIHARLHVVEERVFSLKFDQSINRSKPGSTVILLKIKESWRSNLPSISYD